MKVRSGAVLFILTLAAGCQSTGPSPSGPGPSGPGPSASTGAAQGASGAQGTAPTGQQYSGFLGDYSQLKPAPDREGVMLYVDKSGNYRPYTKVMFEPVTVVLTPNPENKEVPKEALARMSDNFLGSFKRALSPEYQVVNEPGPDVLRVRSAITGVQPAKPAKGVTDFIPIKAVFNVGREAVGDAPRVAEMTGEMEVLDPNGKRVAAATATRKGDKKLPQGEQVSWNELQSISDYWAKGFRQRLDELRGVSAQQ
jgi:hypothetical protein